MGREIWLQWRSCARPVPSQPAMEPIFLDCKGLNCPMPIVRLSQALRPMAAGNRVVVEADDPAFRSDLEAWARRFGHIIVEYVPGQVQRATVEKQGAR